jgi:hypothetical protein
MAGASALQILNYIIYRTPLRYDMGLIQCLIFDWPIVNTLSHSDQAENCKLMSHSDGPIRSLFSLRRRC